MTSSSPFVSLSHVDRKFLRLFACLVASLLLCAGRISAQNASHAPGWVVISIGDYRTLHAKAYPPDREPEPPPVDATLTRVDYDLRIDGDLAAGRASLTVDVLKDGWVRVPIPAGLLVREAKLDGKLVSLVPGGSGKGSNQLSALLSRRDLSCFLILRCRSSPMPEKRAFPCLRPPLESRAHQSDFRSRAWKSSLPVDSWPIRPSPGRKASGWPTHAGMSR
jgi:hypothetical protein